MIIDTLKILADTNRLRILNLLGQRELCVCELEYVLEISQSNLSKHLASMSREGVVEGRKEWKYAYYQLSAAYVEEHAFVADILDRIKNETIFKADLEKFENYLKSDVKFDCLQKLLLEAKLKKLEK